MGQKMNDKDGQLGDILGRLMKETASLTSEDLDRMLELAKENKLPANAISFIMDLKSTNKIAKLAMEACKMEYKVF